MPYDFRKINIRLLAAFVALLLLLYPMPTASAAEYSGSCGANLAWSFANGRLTISGSGDMTDYNQVNMPPWYEFRQEILHVTLPEGLTSVGDMAFYDCYNLTAVTVPSTVKEIGKLAFCQCRNISILNLNFGVVSIGRSAFEQCEKLRDLRLPESLTTLGYHAFYNCAGLSYVKIPASVTEMDSGVFAYCENLVRAEIDAPLSVVPSWTFYGCSKLSSIVLHEQIAGSETNAFTGCESLNTVYYAGAEETAEQLREQIASDSEDFGYFGVVTDTAPGANASSGDISVNENGEITVTSTTVTQTDAASITSTGSTTTNTNNQKTAEAEVAITIFSEEGWQLLMEAIRAAQEQLNQQANEGVENGGVNVDVYLPDSSGVPADILNSVAGSNVDMNVQNEDGTKYNISGSALEHTKEQGSVQFSYSAQRMEEPDFSQLSGVAAYTLQFNQSSDIRVEVMIRLPSEFARNTATLYQVNDKELVLLQSVVIDSLGYAHFYLANIDAEQGYRIGINVPDIDQETVIVPKELHKEYGVTDTYVDITQQYVFTGRKSSWGVSVNQVTWILFAVMGGCVVAVGVVMYILNKLKLKKGYVPDISEEDLKP